MILCQGIITSLHLTPGNRRKWVQTFVSNKHIVCVKGGIVYSIQDDELTVRVVTVGHRQHIYR